MTSREVTPGFSQSTLRALQLGRDVGTLVKHQIAERLNGAGEAVQELLHASRQRLGSFVHLCQGRLPWTLGYGAYKSAYIERLIGYADLIQIFQEGRELPDGFGIRLDERVIEYPWVFSRLHRYTENNRFLDAGSTLNQATILRHPFVRPHKWTLLTLAPESKCFWDLGVSYAYEDLRWTPFRDGWFDAVFCISVIEHVGMDNVLYTSDQRFHENNPHDYLKAISEMWRILRRDGWLYITLPFGQYEDHGWLQQFDSAMLSALISHFQPHRVNKVFYRYTPGGWRLATEQECKDLAYFDIHARKFSGNHDARQFDHDFAAAARGVACVELQK